LFCLSHWYLPNDNTFSHGLGIVEKPSMDLGAQGRYIMFKPTIQEILNIWWFIVIEYFIKLKVKHLGELGCTFVIVGKFSMNRILWKWFCNF
jgi:hypothetical protein